MKKANLKRILTILGNLLMIASIIFIIDRLISYDVDFSFVAQPRILLSIILLTLISGGCVFIYAFAWRQILAVVSNKKVSYRDTGLVFAKANLGKYMPGNVMHYVGRNLFGASLGLSQPQIAFGSMVEVAFQLVTASIWVLVLAGKGAGRYLLQLYAQISAPLTYVFAVAIVFASCVAVFTILLKNGYVIKIINFFKNKSFTGLALQLFLYNSIGFFVGALILMVMMWWSAPFEGSAISIVISAYIFSWTVGFLIPGAPAGMGVREAVLLFMLADVCGAEIVLPAAVIQRVIYIFGDVLAFLFCLALSHKQSAS